MSAKLLIALACLVIAAAATPVLVLTNDNDLEAFYEEQADIERFERSPGGGSVQLEYNQDRFGKTAAVQYNQNLYKSSDGRLTLDAYARGERNFDYNRNDYGGGLQGSYHFG